MRTPPKQTRVTGVHALVIAMIVTLTPPPARGGTPVAGGGRAVPVAAKGKHKTKLTSLAAAFPVSTNLLLSSAEVVAGATETSLQDAEGGTIACKVVRVDAASGLALLRTTEKGLAPLPLAATFTGGNCQCAAITGSSMFGPTAELLPVSVQAHAEKWTVRFARHPTLSGAPLLVKGKVVGIELATRDAEAAAIPAATLEQVRNFLGDDLPKVTPEAPADPTQAILQLSAVREVLGN